VMMHHFQTPYQIVNLKQLQRYDDSQVVGPPLLKRDGLIKKLELPLKILGDGQLERALVVRAQAFSKSARTKIEASGGKAEVI
jgi:large subunit ribosomal protein L15